MAIRNYVGARYVPKFADPIGWQANTSYEAMVIVTYNNSSYTSKIPVPPTVGNPAENSKYWALTGNYNAQIEEYRQETADHINNKENPHGVTKAQVGLGNVDNVSKSDILLSVYPVGSIYKSTNSMSPAELFGGTWERIKDQFLLASGDTYTAGSTGGEAEHTLTQAEIPNGIVINENPKSQIYIKGVERTSIKTGNDWIFAANKDFAELMGTQMPNQPHNNMPPYLTVYMWKRVA